MTKAQILIVDDEPDILELVTITCARLGLGTRRAQNLAEAKQHLSEAHFDLCLTDMRLPDGNGVDLVRFISEQDPSCPVAVLTAYGNMDTAVAAMKAGAFDFVSKPVDLQVLRGLISSALKLNHEKTVASADTSGSILVGDSALMRETRSLIAKLARNQAPVFITGESGTGKELAARLIHSQGPRRDQPFVPVNCGAIPAELMESELFGHRKGSFTGAVSDKDGLFQVANGGTLFLDEIADLPLPMQVKLLRAIQQKSVRPVGSPTEVEVDVRIISASHCNLESAVEQGRFRHDLFYRIKVIELTMPPLRDRPEDIPPLADAILQQIAEHSEVAHKHLSAEALSALQTYPFPGNVRELQNILERASALADGIGLGPDDLQLPSQSARHTPAGHTPAGHEAEPDAPTAPSTAELEARPLEDRLDAIERRAILDALDATHWNRTAAAKRLGMTPRSLRYRLSKLGLN
jgi:two-component system response regulator PilR (NtrC family)